MGKFKRIATVFSDVAVIRPTVFEDDRGFFLETYNREELAGVGILEEFVQDNISHSKKGVVRGLHYQAKKAQCKLVRVLQGKIFDVVVDIRKGSKTYGQHIGIELSSDDPCMLYIPIGFAHGFMALADNTDVMYKVTDYYAPEYDAGIRWNDPDLGISWPLEYYEIRDAIVSPKDAVLPMLKDIQSPFSYQEK
ncbi:MAG: dTDP-4-dehydrorhamnose 3,5-epimerase [Methanomicrobiales archaeon]|nr:dTDP-4-dehydrorhamnose 3,5-epimerase [Methanomicrobiales archaeon]